MCCCPSKWSFHQLEPAWQLEVGWDNKWIYYHHFRIQLFLYVLRVQVTLHSDSVALLEVRNWFLSRELFFENSEALWNDLFTDTELRRGNTHFLAHSGYFQKPFNVYWGEYCVKKIRGAAIFKANLLCPIHYSIHKQFGCFFWLYPNQSHCAKCSTGTGLLT